MRNIILSIVTGLSLVGTTGASAEAGLLFRRQTGNGGYAAADCGTNCQASAPCPTMQTIERTIMVPTTEYEARTIQVTKYRPEARQSTYNCSRQVPVTQQVEQAYTVMIPQTQTRTVNYTECRTVTREEARQYTVQVPVQESRTVTRQVCQMVPVTLTRTVCKDQGRWETVGCDAGATTPPNLQGPSPLPPVPQALPPAPQAAREKGTAKSKITQVGLRRGVQGANCNGCATSNCGSTGCATACQPACAPQRVWVPNIVQQQVAYTCMQRQTTQVSCPITVTVMKPEIRTQTVQIPEIVQEQKTRQVNYTVMVPQQQTRTINVCSWKTVEEQKTRDYTVMVAYQETQQIQVPVCRMVAKTITCQVPAPATCACR